MQSKPWILALGLCLVHALPIQAQVIQGVITITQPD
jgi:hypothetical protein